MTLLPWPTTPASASRTLLVATLSTVALLLWFPPTGLARDTTRAAGKQTEQGRSLKTALLSAGVLRRGTGYRSEHGSAAVRGLQLRLRHLGFRPGPIDGLFGPLTQGAVERFQVARDLTADGVVGPETKRPLLGPVGQESRRAEPRRHDRPSRDRAAPAARTPNPPPAVDAAPPRDVAPATSGAPRVPAEPLPSDGLAPEVAAGLGALATAILLSGAWLLGRPRRGGTVAGDRAEPERPSATNLRLGMVCASLLAVFAIGAVAGALFATHASPDDRATEKARGTAALPDRTGPAGAEVAVRLRPHSSPSSP